MAWYKRVVTKYGKEVFWSAITALIVILCCLLWTVFSGKSFEWQTFSPISEPAWSWRLLSGLVFMTFGRVLYKLKFYLVLYFILVQILRMWELYNALKKVIWYGLMFIFGWYVMPWIVGVLNAILSFFYNVWAFFVYLLPPLGIALTVILVIYLVSKVATKGVKVEQRE